MTRRPRAAALLLAASLTCVIGALVVPGSAGATHRESVSISLNGAPFSEQPRGRLLEVDGISPGDTRQAVMGVRSGMHEPAELLVKLIDVSDADNSCTAPERVVEPSCGTGRGDLGRSLRFTVEAAGSPHGEYLRQWTGTAAQLEHGVDVGVGLAAGSTRWVRMSAALPSATGNAIESDTFGFGLRVALQAAEGTAGVSVHRGTSSGASPSSAPSSGLSLTGVPIALLIVAAVLSGAAGAVLLVVARRRRGASAPA